MPERGTAMSEQVTCTLLIMLCLQIINISSTQGSIGTLQGNLDAPEGSFLATSTHYHLAYRSSKAALNMRKPFSCVPSGLRLQRNIVWAISAKRDAIVLLRSPAS